MDKSTILTIVDGRNTIISLSNYMEYLRMDSPLGTQDPGWIRSHTLLVWKRGSPRLMIIFDRILN